MGASERSAVLGNLAIVPRTRSAREALACIELGQALGHLGDVEEAVMALPGEDAAG